MPRKKATDKATAGTPAKDMSGWTKPRQFRLSEETLTELDAIARHLTKESGVDHSRTDAIRYSSRQTAKTLGLS